MRLIQCHVENFGKLSDVTIDFSTYHVLSEENGWGKSTLAAFLRVMLFGFDGETKRSGLENERRRFAPWQSGSYGGSLTFEAGGTVYTVTRIFGEKKQADIFELRDATTNIKSTDFTDALGEELFLVNSESFQRTVFLGQNDCGTQTTDSINAKIGNIVDNQNDLECYEKAAAALQEVLNQWNPRRKTGEISRLNDSITKLQTEIAQKESLEESIAQYEKMQETERAFLQEKQAEQEELFALQKKVSRQQDAKAAQAAYRQLCLACDETKAALDAAQEAFPHGVLSEEELQEASDACDEMMRTAQAAKQLAFGAEQAAELCAQKERQKELLSLTEKCQIPTFPRKKMRTCMVLAVCFFVAGGMLSLGQQWMGAFSRKQFLLLLEPCVVLAICLMLYVYGALRKVKKNTEVLIPAQAELTNVQQQIAKLEQAQQQAAMYEKNYRQQQEVVEKTLEKLGLQPEVVEKTLGKSGLQPEVVEKTLGKLGLQPEGANISHTKSLLQTAWRKRITWQQANIAWKAACLKKESFLLPKIEEELADLPTLEELYHRQQRTERLMDESKDRLELAKRQLSLLRESYDVWTQQKEQLANDKLRLKDMRQQYKYVQGAKEYLGMAKETLTARYMEPLLKSFSAYYGQITGLSAKDYCLDANMNLTVQAHGMQREIAYLSRGYQDLIGFCLRLALVDAMYQEEKPFLILDDPFVNLDPQKAAGGKRLLEYVSEKYQILYLTCNG